MYFFVTVQPDWVLNQTCSDQQQNTWNKSSATSYKQSTADHNNYNHKSADHRQNGGNFNHNGANISHSTTNFQQTENIYSRIGQPLNGGGYGQNNRAGSLDRVNLDSSGLQERVIPVQIERESRATERSSRQQERSLGNVLKVFFMRVLRQLSSTVFLFVKVS